VVIRYYNKVSDPKDRCSAVELAAQDPNASIHKQVTCENPIVCILFH